jgi:hypothetical protein
LQGCIVEPILLSCINGSFIYDIASSLQKILPISYDNLKMYLFYLIDYDLMSYNGQNQIFIIEDSGYDLLEMIDKEKRQGKNDIKDIVITIE